MESNWERRNRIIRLTEDSVNAMIRPFTDKKIESMEILSGGLINTNYRIKISSYENPFILRIYSRNPYGALKDMEILHRLKNIIPVPEILYCENSDEYSGKPYSIMSHIDGISFKEMMNENSKDSFNIAVEAGEILAEIQKIKFTRPGFLQKGLKVSEEFPGLKIVFNNFFEETIGNNILLERCGKELIRKLETFLEINKDILDESDEKSVLCHADYKPTNIFVNKINNSWKISGILDWEFAFSGPPLFDIGMFLRYEKEFPCDIDTSFIHGYRNNGGVIKKGWKKKCRYLDMLNLLSFMIDEKNRENCINDIRNTIEYTVNDWQLF